MEMIHMTVAYSNAVLAAVLPYVSDFSQKLNLPVHQPIAINQVIWSHTTPYKDYASTGLTLTNHCWFEVNPHGFVDSYRAPTNFYYEQEFTDDRLPQYFGKDNMTTNEALELARDTLLKLGWSTNLTHTYETPEIRGPYDLHKPGRVGGHVPYCQITWEWPKDTDNLVDFNRIQMEVNMDTKQIVGMALSFSRTNHLSTMPLKVDVVPELESHYQKRMATNDPPGKMFINTNAAPRFPGNPPPKQP